MELASKKIGTERSLRISIVKILGLVTHVFDVLLAPNVLYRIGLHSRINRIGRISKISKISRISKKSSVLHTSLMSSLS